MKTTVNNKEILSDINKKLKSMNRNYKYLFLEVMIDKGTLRRIKTNRGISMTSFLQVVDWLEESPSKYFKTE